MSVLAIVFGVIVLLCALIVGYITFLQVAFNGWGREAWSGVFGTVILFLLGGFVVWLAVSGPATVNQEKCAKVTTAIWTTNNDCVLPDGTVLF
jgi:hypothetical protein